MLHHSRLQWPGLPVYVIGPLSLLSVGPGAADMPGMRWAADKIVAAINSPEASAECEAPQPHEGREEQMFTGPSFGPGGDNGKMVRGAILQLRKF